VTQYVYKYVCLLAGLCVLWKPESVLCQILFSDIKGGTNVIGLSVVIAPTNQRSNDING